MQADYLRIALISVAGKIHSLFALMSISVAFSLSFCFSTRAEPVESRAATVGASTSGSNSRSEIAGIVIQAKGLWQVSLPDKSVKTIIEGDPIPYGSALRTYSRRASLKARLINGERLSYPGNYKLGRVLKPLEPEVDKRPWWVIALDIITAPNGDHIAPIARGDITTSLSEAVVTFSDDSIALAEIFQNGDEDGNYDGTILISRLDLITLLPETASGKSAVAVQTDGTVRLVGASPGIYEVRDRLQEGREGDVCWILLADARDSKSFRDRFIEAKKSLDSWGDISSNTKRRLLRALLVALGRTQEGRASGSAASSD